MWLVSLHVSGRTLMEVVCGRVLGRIGRSNRKEVIEHLRKFNGENFINFILP
jgi:hypothetical protein